MTEDVIDKLQPGPDLDALVAEKVMGWLPGTLESGVALWWETEDGTKYPHDALFSSKIVLAWEVVKKLSCLRPPSTHYKPAVRLQLYEHDGIAICEVPFVKFCMNSADEGVGSHVMGDTLPDRYVHNMDVAMCVAICRAALKAVKA